MMSKVLLIGYNPPQLEKNSKVEAAHYRTWQFLGPLIDDGHQICLCANDLNQNSTTKPIPDEWANRLECHELPFRRQFGWVSQLQKIHDNFNPDCIIAVNFDCCLSATKLRTDKPIWMDIYGDYLTIIQVARYRAGTDRGITTSIAFVREVLQTGDIFSVCGTPQEHALVGELAMAGRLNSSTFGYNFTRVVLPGALPVSNELQLNTKNEARPRLGTKGVPNDAFVVLWCGGYNTWTDVDTLFVGLKRAMSQDDKIHYVSVGANTYQAPDNVYTRFLRLIESSSYRDRFHMLGWRPWTEVADYYRESDVGLNIDAMHYETIYGTRTRLVEMLAIGLPVITSIGCELSDLLSQKNAALTFDIGDSAILGQQIVKIAQDAKLRQVMAANALNYANNGLSFASTTNPVRVWVREPHLAPDKRSTNLKQQFQRLEYQTRALVRQVVWRFSGLDR